MTLDKKLIAIPAIAIAAGISLSACGTSVTKAAAAVSAVSAPAATSASPSASPSSAPLSGPVGTTYTATGPNGPNGQTTEYSVTLVQVEQQATLGQYETLTNGSDHVTAAEFTIKGMTGQSSDDANSVAVAVGTDNQNYTPAMDDVTAGTNFNSGEFNVTTGQTVTGWVSFELAPGTNIASIQWSPGIGGQTATWNV